MNDKKLSEKEFEKQVGNLKQHDFDARLSKEKLEKNQAVSRYKDLLADFEAFRSECGWLDLLNSEFARSAPIEPRTKTGTSESVAIATACDWHVYERVLPREVNALNEYNPEIAKARIERFWQGVLRWVEIHRAATKIDTLVITFLGDLITNMLHDDQVEGNAGTPQEEILFALENVCAGLDLLLEQGGFKKIIACCCDGNHGRDTKFVRASGRARHSHEWLLYQFLAKLYLGKIDFSIAEAYHLYQDIYDWKFRLHHGDLIRYQGGVGGISIPMNKAISEWNKALKADFDIFGHWHSFLNPSNFLSVPSLIGYTPYAITIKAAYEPPAQMLTIVSAKRGITSVNRIYV